MRHRPLPEEPEDAYLVEMRALWPYFQGLHHRDPAYGVLMLKLEALVKARKVAGFERTGEWGWTSIHMARTSKRHLHE